jgi:hypothetical protein
LLLIDTRVAVVGIGGRLCTDGSESRGGMRGEVVAAEKYTMVAKHIKKHVRN